MEDTISKARRSLLVVGLLLASCDPVRPGDYQGDFPSPQTLDLSRLPNLSERVSVNVESLSLQAGRVWAFGSGESDVLHPEGRSRVQAAVWRGLVQGMERTGYGYLPSFPIVAFGTVHLVSAPDPVPGWAIEPFPLGLGLNHLLVASDTDRYVQPVGPGGPTIPIKAGFQILHRTCSPENLNQFEIVPLDTAIEMVPYPHAASESVYVADYLRSCGLTLATPDLGQPVFGYPAGYSSGYSMQSMVWSPGADKLYFLAGLPADAPAAFADLSEWNSTLGSMDVPSLAITNLASAGHYLGPLQVATNGTSLLFNQLHSYDSSAYGSPQRDLVRLSLEAGGPLFRPVPSAAAKGLPSSDTGAKALLSPDGVTLAYGDLGYPTREIHLLDVATEGVRNLPHGGTPRAWSPDGKALLVQADNQAAGEDNPQASGLLLPSNGSSAGATFEGLPTTLSWDISDPLYAELKMAEPDRNRHYFWTATGPKVVTQDRRGVLVQDIITQQFTELVEPSRVAVIEAPLQAIVATDQIFAWAIQCFDIGETACNAELRRLSMATGARDVVATANQVLAFAVSPDGRMLALALDTRTTEFDEGIYLKTLAP